MKVRLIAFIAVLLAACIGFWVYYSVIQHQIATPPHQIVEPVPPPKPETIQDTMRTFKIYRVGIENNQEVLRAVDVQASADKSPMETAIRCLIEDSGNDKLVNPMPQGTRLISLKFRRGVATVNFSQEFCDNFHGGSEDESMVVGAILRTLGQFPKVKKVRLMVEGKPIDTLGHLDLSGSLDVTSADSELGSEN